MWKRQMLTWLLVLSVGLNVWAGLRLYRQWQRDQETTRTLESAIHTAEQVLSIEGLPAGAYNGLLYYFAYMHGRVRATEYRWPVADLACEPALSDGITATQFILVKEGLPPDKTFVDQIRQVSNTLKVCAGH